MASAIDPAVPADNINVAKSDLRANYQAAKDEIEELQDRVTALLAALNLAAEASAFTITGLDNVADGSKGFIAILGELDDAISAADGGGGGGASELDDITDILSPDEDVRAAFQASISAATENTDFAFNLGNHAGKLITVDNASNSVTMTFPDPATISRPDGFLCRIVLSSGVNFGAVEGPSGTLRYQGHRQGETITQTTVFIGLSRDSGFRGYVDIYKDGPLYTLFGHARAAEADDLRYNADGSVVAAMLASGSITGTAFPSTLDLGGSKAAGGSLALQIEETGTRTLAQTDSGKTIVYTGGGDVTWQVPTLDAGTQIEVENEGGNITFALQDNQTPRGGLTQASSTTALVKWLINGTVVLLGTS